MLICIEYGLTDERWTAIPLDKGIRQVMAGGMRIMFQREAILSRHLAGGKNGRG